MNWTIIASFACGTVVAGIVALIFFYYTFKDLWR